MLTSSNLNLKHALLLGTSVAAFAWAVAPALAQDTANGSQETVIVTGTRVQGMTAADSAAPITVLGTDALTHGTGSNDLRQALGQMVPSFTAQQFGGDASNLTLSASLRGLSPNDTLVLVNGHRRHYSGNLHVDTGDFASGSSAADLSLIPEGAIDHVEVLLDGAAAQYGTDAIAGVINIILKNKSSGGQFSATAGDYFDNGGVPASNGLKTGGTKYDLSYNMGLPLFDHGFVNFTVEKEYGNFTQNGGPDYRVASQGPNGEGLATGPLIHGDIPLAAAQKEPGYPRINPIDGNPEYQLTMGELNSQYDFSDNLSLYAFGTIGHKFGKSYENNRLGDQNIATPGSSQPCSATNLDGYNTVTGTDGTPACAPGVLGNNDSSVGTIAPNRHCSGTQQEWSESRHRPGGFVRKCRQLQLSRRAPYVSGRLPAFGSSAGRRLSVQRWLEVQCPGLGGGRRYRLRQGYRQNLDMGFSGNRSLFIDTHTSPTNFYDGSFTASQFTGTIDATHAFNVGMASPLTVAVGVEAREDTYAIGAGDAASYYKEGAQSFPGFAPADAGDHSRKNYAGYIDLALAPIEALQIDVAGRAEHYTDFGDAQIGKITARYDFTPQWAIRGTISTGFRAPTLAEEFYTTVNVSPTSATLQLPADSAAANILGLTNLKPEISTSYSAGIVAHPLDDLSVTVDAYSIAIGNRIVPSSTVYSKGGTPLAPTLVNAAIAKDGVILDPTATQVGASAFLNGISTLTQGVDLTASYPTDFGDYGLVDWTLGANYNTTAISRLAPTPTVITNAAPGATFFTDETNYDFSHSAPAEKGRSYGELDAGPVRGHPQRDLLWTPAQLYQPQWLLHARYLRVRSPSRCWPDGRGSSVQYYRAASVRDWRQQHLQYPSGHAVIRPECVWPR